MRWIVNQNMDGESDHRARPRQFAAVIGGYAQTNYRVEWDGSALRYYTGEFHPADRLVATVRARTARIAPATSTRARSKMRLEKAGRNAIITWANSGGIVRTSSSVWRWNCQLTLSPGLRSNG